jgi:membrane associated rhomboid family serine protease
MIPLRDTIPSRHWPVMTWLLILANIAVFYHQSTLSPEGYNGLIREYGLNPRETVQALLQGQIVVLPLFGYMFLHGGLFHICSNLWALWLFGDNVEDKMGAVRFLLFFLISGVVSGLVQIYANPGSPVPTIGASGAIAGVMGAYLIMYPRSKITTLIPIFIIPWFVDVPAMIYLAFWFISQIYSALGSDRSGLASGVAWWAHVGGFVTGMFFHRFFYKPGRSQRYT